MSRASEIFEAATRLRDWVRPIPEPTDEMPPPPEEAAGDRVNIRPIPSITIHDYQIPNVDRIYPGRIWQTQADQTPNPFADALDWDDGEPHTNFDHDPRYWTTTPPGVSLLESQVVSSAHRVRSLVSPAFRDKYQIIVSADVFEDLGRPDSYWGMQVVASDTSAWNPEVLTEIRPRPGQERQVVQITVDSDMGPSERGVLLARTPGFDMSRHIDTFDSHASFGTICRQVTELRSYVFYHDGRIEEGFNVNNQPIKEPKPFDPKTTKPKGPITWETWEIQNERRNTEQRTDTESKETEEEEADLRVPESSQDGWGSGFSASSIGAIYGSFIGS